MMKINLMLALVLVTVCVTVTSLPTPDEERYFDKELSRELINLLNSVHYAQALNYPCQYCSTNSLTPSMAKRNSELINSLLSLPKNMNDAGK